MIGLETIIAGLAVYVAVRLIAGFLGINPLEWGRSLSDSVSSTTNVEVTI